MTKLLTFQPIGVVKTVFTTPQDTKMKKIDRNALIELSKIYQDGLVGLEGFSHVVVVFNFHLSKGYDLFVKPLKYNPTNKTVGVFATHSPFRPNAIGVSIVKIVRIEENLLFIENKDILNNSPVLDIKPYLPEDTEDLRFGWYIQEKQGENI